jgi:hypothetical protein
MMSRCVSKRGGKRAAASTLQQNKKYPSYDQLIYNGPIPITCISKRFKQEHIQMRARYPDYFWESMFKIYHDVAIDDTDYSANKFVEEYIDKYHPQTLRLYGSYPSTRTFWRRLKMYRLEHNMMTDIQLLDQRKQHCSINSTLRKCNFKQVLVDKSNELWILFSCGHPKKLSLLDAKDGNGKLLIPCHLKNPDNQCPDCLARAHCGRYQEQHNKNLLELMSRTNHSAKLDWKHGTIHNLSAYDLLVDKLDLPDIVLCDPSFIALRRKQKYVQLEIPEWVDGITTDQEAREETRKILGGFYPSYFDLNDNKKLDLPSNGYIGVAKWKVKAKDCEWNYGIMDRTKLDNNDIVEIGRMGQRYKCLPSSIFKRSGFSTGIGLPPLEQLYDYKAFSQATKDTPRVYCESGSTYKTVYQSNNPRNTNRPEVSFGHKGDMKGRKFSKEERLVLLERYSALRNMSTEKLKSRIRACVAIYYLGLDNNNKSCVCSIMAQLQQAINDVLQNNMFEHWRKMDPSLSLWDIILLEWATHSEECCNFMATAVHKDGAGRDFESMMVFGLVEDNNLAPASTITKEMTGGLTVLPIQGVAFYTRPGITVLHMRLDHTAHVSDATRNTAHFAALTDYECRILTQVYNA